VVSWPECFLAFDTVATRGLLASFLQNDTSVSVHNPVALIDLKTQRGVRISSPRGLPSSEVRIRALLKADPPPGKGPPHLWGWEPTGSFFPASGPTLPPIELLYFVLGQPRPLSGGGWGGQPAAFFQPAAFSPPGGWT